MIPARFPVPPRRRRAATLFSVMLGVAVVTAFLVGAIALYNNVMTNLLTSAVQDTVIAAAANVRRTFASEIEPATALPAFYPRTGRPSPPSFRACLHARCSCPAGDWRCSDTRARLATHCAQRGKGCGPVGRWNFRNATGPINAIIFSSARASVQNTSGSSLNTGVTFPWWGGAATLRASNRPADHTPLLFTFVMENIPAEVCEVIGAAFIGDPEVAAMATAGNRAPRLNNANQRVDLGEGVNLGARCALDDDVHMKIQFRG